MPIRALTVASVARVKPPKTGQADYFDQGFPGLALRVSYGGARAWVFFYRLHGKQRRMSLGRFPAMSLIEAREAWRAARLAVSQGESPTHIRPATADSFAAIAAEWLDRDQAKNRSAAEVRRAIEHDVMPKWTDRPIDTIARRDVLELIDGVADRGAVTMARRLHAHLHRLFKWAVGRGIIEANPMADLPKPGEAVERDRVLTDVELAAVWKAAEKTTWPFGPAVRLLALTLARREEISALRWSEIHGDEIRLPGERSKTGEPRTIPLAPAAVELIGTLPRIGDHVFTTNGTAAVSGWSKAKRALDAKTAEIHGRPLAPWRIHDLRRTGATGLQRLGVALQVIESILGHVGGSRAGIVGVYQRHRFAAEQRVALEAWSHEVERIVAGQDHAFAPAAAMLTLSSSAPMVEIKPINSEWLAAIARADATTSPEPLLDYFRRQPGTLLGPAETFLLQRLLERVNFRRKKGGRFTPVGEKSRAEINETGAAYVRELKKQAVARGERLSDADAIDMTVRTFPQWFGVDGGLALANHMKRG
jgi:integrase